MNKKVTPQILLVLALLFVMARQGSAQLSQTFDNLTMSSVAAGTSTVSISTTLPAGWTQINNDGFTVNSALGYMGTNAWIARSMNIFGINDTVAMSVSWYDPSVVNPTSDDYLVSPQLAIPTGSSYFLFWKGATLDASYPDGYEVRISTTGNTAADFQNGTLAYSIAAESTTSWAQHSLDLSAFAGQNIYVAFRNNSTDKYILLIDDIKVQAITNVDAELVSLNIERFAKTNTNVAIKGTVKNNGITINSLNLVWFDGTNYQNASLSGLNITPLSTYEFTHPISFNKSMVGEYTVSVAIASVNGGATESNLTNNHDSTKISTVSNLAHKNVVIESLNGVWSGYTPRGYVAIEDLYADSVRKVNFIGIDVHNSYNNNDPMVNATYSSSVNISGLPGCNVDRNLKDQGVTTAFYQQYVDSYKQHVAPAQVTATTHVDTSTRLLTIDASANFRTTLSEEVRFAVVLVEDSVHGTSTTYDQANFYSYASSNIPLIGAGHNWQNEPNPVPAASMWYNHVGRELIGGYTGAFASIPSTLNDGTNALHTFTYTVPVAYNLNHLKAVVMLVNPLTSEIYNATEVPVTITPTNPTGPISYTQPLTRSSLGSSTNLYSVIVAESNCLTAHQGLNSIMFTKRRNTSTAGGSGVVENAVSVNGGLSFDSTLVVVPDDGIHFCRYPSGAIVNSSTSNVNPTNAFAVTSGPWHPGALWQGNFFGSINFSGLNNNVTYKDNNNLLGDNKSDFARYSIQSCDNGKVYVVGNYYDDINATTALAQGYHHSVLHVGTLSGTNFNWTSRTFPHAFRKDATGLPNVLKAPLCAFSQNGTVGYVVYMGEDSIHYNENKSYQPIVYKTTNAGVSWTEIPYYSFARLPHLLPYLRTTNMGSKRPNFILAYDNAFDVTVDANNNLHIFCNVRSNSSENVDSLNYTWNSQNLLCDLYTTTSGWDAIVIDSLKTNQITAANSPWQASDNSGGSVSSSRLQISRTQDGQKIFYGWADTDYNLAADTSWLSGAGYNIHPDIFVKGLDIQTKLMTPTTNLTANDVVLHGNSEWMYLSNIVLKNGSTYSIPLSRTYSRNGTYDPISPVQHEYIGGAQLTDAQFTIAPHAVCSNYHFNNQFQLVNSNYPHLNSVFGSFYTQNAFTPTVPGLQTLSVIDNLGCYYDTTFTYTPAIAAVATSDYLDTNKIKAKFTNNFQFFWDSQAGAASFEVPKGSGLHAHFASALWLGGLDGAGQAHTAAQTYSQTGVDYQYGPVATSRVSNNYDTRFNRLWKINKVQIQNHIMHYADTSYQMPEVILNWPANGITSNGEAAQLAPFHDANNNGIYEPFMGDYPQIKGDQCIYMIFNDDKTHTESAGSNPFKFDIHVMAYEVCNQNNAIDTTLFIQYKIVNRSNNTYHALRMGIWNDFDLGNGFDDVPGTDVSKNMAFMYNVDNNDDGNYGTNPPAIGSILLDKTMKKCMIYQNTNSSTTGNPTTANHFVNYINGLWLDGSPMTYGGTGIGGATTCSYFAPWTTDLSNPTNWDISTPADYRTLQSTDTMVLVPNSSATLETAFLFQRSAVSNMQSAYDLKNQASLVQNYFNTYLNTDTNALTINITSTNPVVCAGQNITFSATVTNAGTGYALQWFKNNQPIMGANQSSYSSTLLQSGDMIQCSVLTSLSQTATSNYITVTINSSITPGINIAASQTTLCSGTTVFMNANTNNAGNTPAYQWLKNGTPLIGFTSDTISLNNLLNNDIISCVLTSNVACASPNVVTSNSITFVVNTTPNLSVSPIAAAVCAGSPSATLTASGAATYTWSPAIGLSDTSAAQVIASPSVSTTYTVVGTSNGCSATTQAVVTYTSSGTAAVTISATQSTICAGSNVIFTAIPAYGGSAPTYQWKKNGVSIAGAIANIFSSSTLQNNDVITCAMLSNDPCVTATSAISNSITMTVNPTSQPSVTILSSGSNTCAGTNVTFTATPAFGGNTPSYVWKVNGVIASTNGATFSSNSLSNNDTVRCYLTSSAVCATPVTVGSNTITMNVSPLLTPTISIVASQNNFCSGTSVTFTSTISNGGTTPAYQWQKNNINLAGETSASYTSNSLSNNDAITCILTSNATCASPSTISSNSISMNIIPSGTASVQVVSSTGNIICANANNSVIYIANPTFGGSAPTYQWYLNGIVVPGQTSNLYTPPVINNLDSVRCVMTSNASCIPQTIVSSGLIIMNVLPNVTASVSISSTSSNICKGTRVIFTATPGAGITNPIYQWRINGINIPQETGSTFNSTTLKQGDDVSALLFSATECLSSNNVASNNITMTVNQSNFGVGFTANTQTPNAANQFKVQFTNTTSNSSNKKFIWYFGDGTNFTGSLPQEHFYPSNGTYSVALKVVDTTGCVDSLSKSNYISCSGSSNNCNQSITLTPAANSIAGCDGGSVELTCATNATNPTFQWNKNGIPMGGETQSTYIATSQGTYSVTVYKNGGCPVTSTGKQITFDSPSSAAPIITQTGTFQSCTQNSITLTVNSGYSSYLWSTGETSQSINVSQSGLYTVMGTNSIGCNRQSNPIAVNNSAVPAPEICMVLVDSIINKNVIVWEKPISTQIDSFIIFKESNQQSVYQRIGGQPYANLSEFIDYTSNPSQSATVYKLAIKDICGNLTLPSLYHRTIHLQITPNIGTSRVLSWNNNLGYIAQSYVINRGQLGNLHAIDTIPGTENMYTDYPPANTNDTLYRVDIVYSQPCNSSKSSQAARIKASSNSGGNNILAISDVGIADVDPLVHFGLFPNPASNEVNLVLDEKTKLKNLTCYLTDVMGKVVFSAQLNSTTLTIDLHSIESGVYFVKVGNAVVRMVKQ